MQPKANAAWVQHKMCKIYRGLAQRVKKLSAAFINLSLINQHRMVKEALANILGLVASIVFIRILWGFSVVRDASPCKPQVSHAHTNNARSVATDSKQPKLRGCSAVAEHQALFCLCAARPTTQAQAKAQAQGANPHQPRAGPSQPQHVR